MSYLLSLFLSNKDIAYSEGASHSSAQGAASGSSGGRFDRIWCSKLSPAVWGPVHAEERQVGSIRDIQTGRGALWGSFKYPVFLNYLLTGQFLGI